VLAVLVSGCATTGTPPATPTRASAPVDPFGFGRSDLRGLHVRSFEEALALPVGELDIGRAALLLAREDRPALDLPRYLTQLDVLAADLRRRLEESPGASRRDLLASFLYGPGGFTADPADPHGHDPENLYLDRVLERRRGYCVSLGLLGLAVGERLGLPLQGVRAPFHYWLRLDGENIETTDGGRAHPDGHYLRRFPAAALSDAYLHPVQPRTIFAEVLSNRGALAYRAGDLDRALRSLDLALQVDETLPFAWHNRAVVRRAAGDLRGALADLDRAIQIDPGRVHSRLERASLLRDPER
jgi:regulator of sirC expression with transglutaminase-like and TPR domain